MEDHDQHHCLSVGYGDDYCIEVVGCTESVAAWVDHTGFGDEDGVYHDPLILAESRLASLEKMVVLGLHMTVVLVDFH